MKGEELRINNYVKCKVSNDAGIYQVCGIDGWQRIFASKEDERIYNLTVDEQIELGKKYKAPVWHDERLIRIQGGGRDNEKYIESKIGGIPLNEEWLKRFEFRKDGSLEIFYYDHFQIVLPKNGSGFYMYEGNKHLTKGLKYVHHLQNLIYALTGEELTLKS